MYFQKLLPGLRLKNNGRDVFPVFFLPIYFGKRTQNENENPDVLICLIGNRKKIKELYLWCNENFKEVYPEILSEAFEGHAA